MGRERGEELAIVPGLKEGEWVLADYFSAIAPGTRVRPLEKDMNRDTSRN